MDIEPMLRPALGPGDTTMDVLKQLFSKDAQLWAVLDRGWPIAGIVTQIVTDGAGRKVCNIWAVGGSNIQGWFHNLSTIEAWAKSEGCVAVTVEQGRPGWQRMMQGYKVTSVSLEKEL